MKIEIVEHCFGSYVTVDGINLCEEEYVDKDLQRYHRGAILAELIKNIDKITGYDWKQIVEILINDNPNYLIDKENSSHDTCEQCGNWNSNVIYNKL